ncbi:MAG TPA: hypothetical protein VHN77_15520 [Phycisphaerales bacterium]|nr:hypothetical protein [Phycisphaerales bacterium]
MKTNDSRMNVCAVFAWIAGTVVAAPAFAGLVPQSALYTFGGTASAEGMFTSEIDSDSFSGGQTQPSPTPFAQFEDGNLVTTSWQDSSFPTLTATGNAHAVINGLAPTSTQWSVVGVADATVTGDYFNGALGKGHAWSGATFVFSVDTLSAYRLMGAVTGRGASLVDQTWVNFDETAFVELWQGTTLLHRAEGLNPGSPVDFDFAGMLAPGEYRVEARATARTESLAFGQPWSPNVGFDAVLTVPGVPGLVFAVCAAPITLRRRR